MEQAAVQSGANYYCIYPHTNHAPPNTSYWYPLSPGSLSIYEIPSPYLEGLVPVDGARTSTLRPILDAQVHEYKALDQSDERQG